MFDAIYSTLGISPFDLTVIDAKRESGVEGYIDLQWTDGSSRVVIRVWIILDPPDVIEVAMNDLGFRWDG